MPEAYNLFALKNLNDAARKRDKPAISEGLGGGVLERERERERVFLFLSLSLSLSHGRSINVRGRDRFSCTSALYLYTCADSIHVYMKRNFPFAYTLTKLAVLPKVHFNGGYNVYTDL